MQNAGPLYSRESWTRQSRGCSAASTAWDAKNSFECQEKPWDNIRTSDGLYGLQTSSSSKIADFDQEQDQVLHGNLQENVAPGSLAWPEAYSSIGGDGFSQGLSVKAAESDGSDAEMVRLLNTRNADVSPQEFNFQATGSLCGHLQSASAGSLHSGYGLKMEEISRSNGVSVQTALATPPLQRLNFISFSANATDVVKDSAAGDDLSQSFLGRTDKCEDTAAADHKRTSSALEDGEQGGPSKRNRTSEAPSKFKVQVRKEKLGERITALQQLVSPFGKTDTASVLLEAIGYIKFLQDQVQVLSTPYIKGFPSSQAQDGRRGDSAVSNLRGRGLCLVPISSTQLMANANGADYWASGIGGGARL